MTNREAGNKRNGKKNHTAKQPKKQAHGGNGAKAYRTVFLDAGDTLINMYPSWGHMYMEIYGEEAGLEIAPDRLQEAVYAVWGAIHADRGIEPVEPSEEADYRAHWALERDVMRHLGIDDDVLCDRVVAKVRERVREPENYRVFDDVLPALDALRDGGYTLGIISNWSWHLPELIEGLELAGYFDAIISSARVGVNKPHPLIFRSALEATGADPRFAVHVGDSYDADVLGARGVGIEGLLLNRNGDSPIWGSLPEDCPIINSLTGIIPWLEENFPEA